MAIGSNKEKILEDNNLEDWPGLSRVKHVVAIASGKGGVGKSTIASNLAISLSAGGAQVGLMDADIYGPSQPGMLGAGSEKPSIGDHSVKPVSRHGVRFISMGLLMDDDGPVIWRAPIAMKMIHQFLESVEWGDLDYLLIDLPPGTGDVQLTLAQQAPLTGAVIVTTPQDVALGVARKGLKMFEQVNVPILGIIENMSGFTCGHCGEVTAIFKQGGGEEMARAMNVPYLGAIPLDPEIMACSEKGAPVVKQAPDSASARAFAATAEGLRVQIERETDTADAIEPISAELSDSGDLVVQWPDGHQGEYTPYNLRRSCTCAACIDENSGSRLIDDKKIPLDIRIESFQPVGRYAMAFTFSDRHSTGIYKYEFLREICECPECYAARGSKNESFSV
ncbi:MAG: P-loop NTPase [candidate division Zixibacteria bacterium]|nr:P-loop NTPase [candidate division Zixibacteria bacterium]MBU1470917.1 P-loop NTPase [candidate division Zixibacteria bacterium]MBU2624579.1 P-loop NTPase [candidate division Zixibacteria bacterium]